MERNNKGQFKKGGISWNKGRTHSDETKKKIKEANKGKHFSNEHKRKLSEAQKGKHHSNEVRKKISDANMGHKGYWNDKHRSEETKKKISKSTMGKHLSEATRKKRRGCKNWKWKGGVSEWYKKHRAERGWKKLSRKVFERDNFQCKICGSNRKIHAHHIIPWRVEHNDKINNLITLCRSCHPKIEKKWWQYAPMFFEILGIYDKSNESSLFG